jgi:hypothetical protein
MLHFMPQTFTLGSSIGGKTPLVPTRHFIFNSVILAALILITIPIYFPIGSIIIH